MQPAGQTKECGRCHKQLPLSAYGPDPSRSDGLCALCRACRRAAYRQAHGGLERALAKFTTGELLSELQRREKEGQDGAQGGTPSPKT